MKFNKPYPYNLIDDLMLGVEFESEMTHDEIVLEVENIINGLSDIYTKNKHIPYKMQNIIWLFYREGLAYREIGELLEISGGRVGQIKNRALRLLRHPSRLNRLTVKGEEAL